MCAESLRLFVANGASPRSKRPADSMIGLPPERGLAGGRTRALDSFIAGF